MKVSDILLAAPLFWTAVQSSAVPLYHFHYIANNPNADEATRAAANFTYHHTLYLQERRHRQIVAAAGGAGGEGGQPFLDDTPFDYEQDPTHAVDIAQELAAIRNAQLNQPVEPGRREGGGSPGEGTARRRHARDFLEARQIPTPYRGVWENDQSCGVSPPKHKVRETNSPVASDPDVNALFNNQQQTDFLYNIIYGRNGLDNSGYPYYGIVHYCANYNNLFWDGVGAILGDNDGYAYVKNSYPYSLSFITHEYTHGVIEKTNPLFYSGMSGALNEHLADVFGVLAEQFRNFQDADQASWLVGADTVVGGFPSRTFIAPGTAYNTPALGPDRQVGSMADYYYGPDDNFGVHFNSGIPNRAFYLFSIAVGGRAYYTPGQIWYEVMIGNEGKFDYEGESFNTFADKTVQAAGRMGGVELATTLQNAWKQVGISPFSYFPPTS